MHQYNVAQLTASGTSLYHRNLLAYSFLSACQEIGALFCHFDVCGKECLPVNEELAKWASFQLQSSMQYLLRHFERLPDGKMEVKAENYYLFMCRSNLTMMFHVVADNFRELGERRALGRNLSLAKVKNRMTRISEKLSRSYNIRAHAWTRNGEECIPCVWQRTWNF